MTTSRKTVERLALSWILREREAAAARPNAPPQKPRRKNAMQHEAGKESPHAPGSLKASPHEKGAWARNRRWRAKNVDRHRASHRDYMRTWRARQKGQAAPAPQTPAHGRLIDIRDWPEGHGCTFEAKWPDGFKVEIQVKQGAAVLTADAWVETISLAPDGKHFICEACERPTPTLHEGPEQFLCEKCTAAAIVSTM
jgi:hypothetical protein